MRWLVPSLKVRPIAGQLEKVIAISIVVVGAGWFVFEFAAQFVYLRPEFRQPQPELGYIWATPMKGRYAYLSRAESLLEIYTPAGIALFLVGGTWLHQIRKARETK